MATISLEFQSAPAGRRVISALIFAGVVVLTAVGANVAVALKGAPPSVPWQARGGMVAVPVAIVTVLVFVYRCQRARIATFRIEDKALVLGKKRYPLDGLVSVERDPQILRWALRVRGNSGLGAIRGRFWSKRVGKFEAFMTDPEKAVVLRWPEQVVAVSPLDPEFFIYSVRSAAGLK